MESAPTRKIQVRIISLVFLLYIIAFLNRINLGFAALTLNRELGITPSQFGLMAGIFLIGYFLMGIPSNLLLHRIGARVWVPCILILSGVAAVVTGLVHSVPRLYVSRFALGLAEAGFFPGIVLYMTYWVPRIEQARAIAVFMLAQPVTSILGGPLSGWILDRVHWLGLSSWRWMLILEGAPAMLGGLLTFCPLPDNPEGNSFLSAAKPVSIAEPECTLVLHLRSAQSALSDKRVWHLAVIGFTQAVGSYSLVFWMPQLIRSPSAAYSNTAVGLLAGIPYVIGLASLVLFSRSSDRGLERRFHVSASLAIGGIAYICLTLFHFSYSFLGFLSVAAYQSY